MAAAQGVAPGSTPFRYDYPDAYFDYGGVKLPRSVAGGSKGSGTLNAAGLFVSGLPVFATNGAMTPGHCVSVGSNSTLLDAGAPCGGGGSSGSVTSGTANQLAYYPATGASVTGLGLSGLLISGGVLAPVYGTAANTVAQGNDARIVGASNASNITSGTLSDARLAPDVTILGNGFTGSGSLVRGTSPLLVTPLLGTPQSGVATNITGLPLTTGVVGVLPAANGGTGKGSFAAGSDYVAPNGSGSGLTGITAAQVGAVASVTAGAGLSGGTISSSGTIAVIYGTGANTAAQGNDVRITGALQASNNLSDVASPATARTNLGAAAKGANSDITSIAGLTTALTAAQGGTGKTSFTAGADYLAPSGSGSALTGITASQIGGLATSATTDTTNATNITTGTIADARLASDVTMLGNSYTGGGSLVRAASPVLVTPILGTPQSGVATNLTGLPLTTGVAGVLPPANGGTGKTSFAVGTDYVAPTGSGAGLTGITAAQVGALATNGSGAALTGITAAQVGAISSITAGSGLSGGTISSTGTIAVNYGTAANTAAQGNDSRITGALSVTAAAATYLQLTGGTLSGNLAIAGQAITSGASSALVATDRNGASGTAQLYRSAGLNYLFDSTYGNTILWDGAGNVTVPKLIATSATLASNPTATSNGQDVVTSSWTKQFFPGLSTSVQGIGSPGFDMGACTSTANCTFFMYEIAPSYPTANTPTLRIDKHFPASGGSSNTVTALQVNSYTGLNDPGFVWGAQSVVYNGTLASASAQSVGASGSIFKQLNGQAAGSQIGTSWGLYGECQDQTATPNPTAACIGAEIDSSAAVGAGADTNQQRVALQLSVGIYNGNDSNVHFGVGMLLGSGGQGATLDHGIEFGAGKYGIGIDFTRAAFPGGTILMNASQQNALQWQDTSNTLTASTGFQIYAANDNNMYFDNYSNTNQSFRGPSGDLRMLLSSTTMQVNKTLDLHYAGTTSCTVTGSVAVKVNGTAHQIPYC